METSMPSWATVMADPEGTALEKSTNTKSIKSVDERFTPSKREYRELKAREGLIKQVGAEINRHRLKYSRTVEEVSEFGDQKSDFDHSDVKPRSVTSASTGRASKLSHVSATTKNSDFPINYLEEKHSSNTYEILQKLLMTNGEVDINKVLCLHLITLCTPSPEAQLPRRQRRLKDNQLQYVKILPRYLLAPQTLCRCKSKCQCNNLQSTVKMAVKVNKQIEILINTIIEVLSRINMTKLRVLLALACNISYLKDMMANDFFWKHTKVIAESGIVNDEVYSKSETLLVVGADYIAQIHSRSKYAFKILLPQHYPLFQIPVFSLMTSGGALFGDLDESAPLLLNLYKQVTMGKKINDEPTGIAVLPDFSNTRLAVVSDDGTDFAAITKSGSIIKPKTLSLAQNLASLVRTTTKTKEKITVAEEDRVINYNPRPQFSRNPAVLMESLMGLAREGLGLADPPPKSQMGVSEVERRRMESEQLRCSILRRLSNADRMMLATEAAKQTRGAQEMLRKSTRSSIEAFSKLVSSVLSRRTIMALARSGTKREREFMFRPMSKGGLGFGDLILQEGQDDLFKSPTASASSSAVTVQRLTPKTIELEKDQIKNEIVTAELMERINSFNVEDITIKE